jgi:hypothetical protein
VSPPSMRGFRAWGSLTSAEKHAGLARRGPAHRGAERRAVVSGRVTRVDSSPSRQERFAKTLFYKIRDTSDYILEDRRFVSSTSLNGTLCRACVLTPRRTTTMLLPFWDAARAAAAE